MLTLHDPRQNHIIASLPAADFGRLFEHLELTRMHLGQVLGESGGQMHHIYFPTTAIVSSLSVLENGASAGFSVIGNEGVVGASLFMGGEATHSRSVVHGAGYAYRIKKRIILDEFNRAGPMQRLLLRHVQSVLTQIAQTAVCNRHHSVEQQLCRCLLMRLDRSTSSKLVLTQELIASVLGVRREGVTEAAGRLQRAGLIEYRRGHITILDRAGIEERVCECYAVVKKESDRLIERKRTWAPTTHMMESLPIGLHPHSNQRYSKACERVG